MITIDEKRAKEALEEAVRRYPEAVSALIFLWGASGLGWRNPTEEQLAWARQRIAEKSGNSLSY